jgi:hypothetical protein
MSSWSHDVEPVESSHRMKSVRVGRSQHEITGKDDKKKLDHRDDFI